MTEEDGPKNPLDVSHLRLTQDFAGMLDVKKLLTTVPVRKPSNQEYVRVHPDPQFRMPVMLLEHKEDRSVYVVSQELWPELSGDVSPRQLYTTITRQGIVMLWPVRLPGEDGRLDDWSRSAMEAAERATAKWVRIRSNMGLGAYDIYEAAGDFPEPQWPEVSFQGLINIAFKGKIIDSPEHSIVLKLRGVK